MTDEDLTSLEYLMALGAVLTVVAVIVWLVTRALLKAAQFPKSIALVIALSILTLVALTGAIATTNDGAVTALIGLAGTGLGALAGAVSSVFGDGRRENVVDPEEERPETD